MGVQWTKEQQEVIRLRDRNILVSAAAGSGKTAVLVERILSKITDKEHPVQQSQRRKEMADYQFITKSKMRTIQKKSKRKE